MFTEELDDAFAAKLREFAVAQTLHVDWGDQKDYEPDARTKWLRPRLNPNPTKPGPASRGRFMGTLRGRYSVECMTPFSDGRGAAFSLADFVSLHFFPAEHNPQQLIAPSVVIRLEDIPSVDRLVSLKHHNRAVAHIPYLVYAKSA